MRRLRIGEEKRRKKNKDRNHSCKKCPHLLRRAVIKSIAILHAILHNNSFANQIFMAV